MEHHYCLFFKNEKLQFGWIKEVRKSKLVVVPEQGKEFNCAPSRTEYIWKGKVIVTEKEALEHLTQMSLWARGKAEALELAVIHELCEPGDAFSLEALAENFLEEPENGWLRVALFLALKADGRLFQQKKDLFYARSAEELAIIDEQEHRKQEISKRQLLESDWATQLLNSDLPTIEPDQLNQWQQFLHRLRNFVIHLDKSQEKDYFSSLFQCSLKDPDKAERRLLNCLALTDQPLSWGRLVLLRSSVDFIYEQAELEAAKKLVEDGSLDSRFGCETFDQRHLEVYTVDHSDTLDFDDALSWEKTREQFIVRVHIADVASRVSETDLLFEKASDRISSLYTIKKTFPMFVDLLSEDLFSLKQQTERGVLTFEFTSDLEGNLIAKKIYRSLIKVSKNCTYEEIDEAIQTAQSFWSELWYFCRRQTEIRRENGSLELDRCEVKLDISDPEHITLKAVRENTPASLIIQELAILTNHFAATFAKEKRLPCLFRNQLPYTLSKELGEDEKPALKDIIIQPAHISLIPEGHSALGLDCYLQVTSPIRRFLDLVNQITILSELGTQRVTFSEETLLEWARRGEDIQREFNLIERRLSDHWKIKYLEQHNEELYDAQFIRMNRNGKAQVNLILLQLQLEMSDAVPESGFFRVAIDSVSAELNKVVVRRIVANNPTEDSTLV